MNPSVERPVLTALCITTLSLKPGEFDSAPSPDHLTICTTCGAAFPLNRSCSCPPVNPHLHALRSYITQSDNDLALIHTAIVIQDFWGEFVCSAGLTPIALQGEFLHDEILPEHARVQHHMARTRGFQRYTAPCCGRTLDITVLSLDVEGIVYTHTTFCAVGRVIA